MNDPVVHLSSKEAAVLVASGVKPKTVMSWMTRGVLINKKRVRLQSTKLGGRRVTTPEWVKAMLAAFASDSKYS